MCGIVGFVGEDQERIERMTMALRHRGPDHQAWEVVPGASIGSARLAILDPSPAGNQPMWNDDRTVVITYNGEIFNYRTLRDAEGFSCHTGTDTEVILKLYDRYGPAFVSKISGMFSLGLYDTRTRAWFLARDGSGITPLFTMQVDRRLFFASELRALLRILPQKPALNERSLSHYMALQYVPGPQTICEGIEQLPPGTILMHRDGRSILTPFTTEVPTPPSFATTDDFVRHFPDLMEQVVSDHLISDRPLGIFLSGGVDSTVVLHHMQRTAKRPVRTFTVRFEATAQEDEPRFNQDANLALRTAKHYSTDHTEILFTAQECRRVYAETALALDQPNADSVAMAQYVLARRAKQQVDVVLCGAGGDELFGGYPRYRIARAVAALQRVPLWLRRLLPRIPRDILALPPGPHLADRLLCRPVRENQTICREWFQPEAQRHLFEERWATLSAPSPVRALMEFDRTLWLVDESLRLADSVTLAHGLECRIPFLDPRVIQASLHTPAQWHVGWRATKRLLKRTYTPVLPPHFREIAKACFYPPMAKWIRRECAPLIEESLQHPRVREYFNVEVLRALFTDHREQRRYALHPLMSIAQLRAWFDTIYDA